MARYIWSALLAFLILMALVGNASADTPITVDIKYIKYDHNFGVHRYTVDIQVKESSKLVYLENYYSIDGNGQPRWFSSNRLDAGIVRGNVHLEIQRPRHRYGGDYSIIEKVVILNGERTTHWVDFSKYW